MLDKVESGAAVDQSTASDQNFFEEYRNAALLQASGPTLAECRALDRHSVIHIKVEIAPLSPATTDEKGLTSARREIVKRLTDLQEREEVNTVMSTYGYDVVKQPPSGARDYFSEADGRDDIGILSNGLDGAITKNGIESYLRSESNHRPRGIAGEIQAEFVRSLKQIYENWDSLEMAAYKDKNGAMTRESFALGMNSLPQRQHKIEETIEYYFTPEAIDSLYSGNGPTAPTALKP